MFALGNGYLGVRGAPEEGTPAYDGGMVLNGFHETWPIAYPEDAYGLARTGQTIVAPPDGNADKQRARRNLRALGVNLEDAQASGSAARLTGRAGTTVEMACL